MIGSDSMSIWGYYWPQVEQSCSTHEKLRRVRDGRGDVLDASSFRRGPTDEKRIDADADADAATPATPPLPPPTEEEDDDEEVGKVD